MGSRDYRNRERKKQKKEGKKLTPITILSPTTEAEVIKKGKKEPKEGEE